MAVYLTSFLFKTLCDMKSRFNRKLIVARDRFNKKLGVEHQQEKEEVLISKLQHTLGKSRNEVEGLLSDRLKNLLTLVPYSVK